MNILNQEGVKDEEMEGGTKKKRNKMEQNKQKARWGERSNV